MDVYINELKRLLQKKNIRGEVPVAAIVVNKGKIISKAYNKREKTKNPIMHAEVIAIMKACKKLKTWKLDGCEMYVTLKPCDMCSEIIKESRLDKVFYILDQVKIKNTNFIIEKIKTDETFFVSKLSSFFKDKR